MSRLRVDASDVEAFLWDLDVFLLLLCMKIFIVVLIRSDYEFQCVKFHDYLFI